MATPPEIVKAKAKASSMPSTSASTPMASPPPTTTSTPATTSAVLLRTTGAPPQLRTVQQQIQRSNIPVGGMLKELFNIDGSVGNAELLNQNFNNPSVEAKYRNAKNIEIDKTSAPGGAKTKKEISVSRDELPTGIRLDEVLKQIYTRADRDKVKTRDQFAASFDNLLKTIDPADQKFIAKYSQPGGEKAMDYEKFKNAAAEQYQRLVDATKR